MTDLNEKPRISVDFQNSDRLGRVRLNTVGTLRDLSTLGIVLREGLEINLYCMELEGEGTVTYSSEENLWVATVNWNGVRERKSTL
jgi:hypothetical protein